MIIKHQFCYGPDTGNPGGSAGDASGSTAGDVASAGSGAGSTVESTWIPESLKAEKSLEKFKSPEDAFKGYVELERKLGKSIEIPGKDASAEARDKFYERIGRPKTSDEFSSDKPLKDAEIDKAIRSAHAKGLTNEAYAAIAESVQATLDARSAQQKEAEDKAFADAEKVLKERYGDRYERLVMFAGEAFKKLPEGLQRRLDERGFANDPDMVEVLATVFGPRFSGDKLIRGSSVQKGAAKPEDRYSGMAKWYQGK